MWSQSQLQSIQCDCSSFLLNISQLPFVLYVHNAYPYQQNFLECYFGRQNTPSDLCFVQPRRYSSSAYPLQPSHLQLAHGVLSLTSSLLFICPRTTRRLQTRPKVQHIFLGPLSLQLLLQINLTFNTSHEGNIFFYFFLLALLVDQATQQILIQCSMKKISYVMVS